MIASTVSPAFTTNIVEQTRDFYIRYFDATVRFDCGWYLILEFGSPASTLHFMTPRQAEHETSNSAGLLYHFHVEDVDTEYNRLMAEGLTAVVPLEDHPWGDRGFAIKDPNGISLYLYSEREPAEEFKAFFK